MLADASGLVEAIKKAAVEAVGAGKPVNVCFGKVVSEMPLIINVEQKMELGEQQLILTRNVTEYATTISVNWETENGGGDTGETADGQHRHHVMGQKQAIIHNALKTGDEVIIIRQQEGQKYIVVDRIGGMP